MAIRKVLVVTGSRGEYGYIRPLLRMMSSSDVIEYSMVVSNMHLLPEFGLTEEQIVADGLKIDYRIYNTVSGYNSITMSKSLGLLMIQLPEIISYARPDIILISGDRGEMLVSAIVGCHMNIPVAHIQAGEISGNVDGIVRHSITKLSHIHFASNEDAYSRVIKLGEEQFRVFNVGAPLVDEISDIVNANEFIDVRNLYNINPGRKILLYVQHPVTEEEYNSYINACRVMNSINMLPLSIQVVVICPNSDAGCMGIRRAINENKQENYLIYDSMPRSHYISFLKESEAIIGNSSSGIMEAPSCGLPCVNVGRRQLGRLQGSNVINCSYEQEDINIGLQKALDRSFKESLRNCVNPYGDGKSSHRILDVLQNIQINSSLINKKITF